MKFDFWFDLPKALANIIEENLTREEVEYTNVLLRSSEVSLICINVSPSAK
jgi:hypothetical protein